MFRRMENRVEWLDLVFHGWILNPPLGLSKRRGRAAPTVEKREAGTLGLAAGYL
jgi:hypothetical protein